MRIRRAAIGFASVVPWFLLHGHAPAAVASGPPATIPTFARDVAPILYAKCATCHHHGEVAPFALMSYPDARAKAKTIATVCESRYMPPWQAVSSPNAFANDRTLTTAQVATLKAWADAGAPSGNLSTAPKPPTFTAGWLIGEPDFIGQPAKAYDVSSEGADEYRCFVIPTHFAADRYVTSVELKPGARKVVHHILAYVDTSGEARAKDGKDGKPGYASFGGPGFAPTGTLGGWAPGLQPLTMPDGAGMWLPKGADIVLQVHYHKNGKPETDLSSIGLRFATGSVDKRVRWEPVGNTLMALPAGERRATVTADMVLATPVTLLDVIPHMHLLGHDMRVTATFPDGTTRNLIYVDKYDFNWQTRYIFRHPVRLPKGAHIELVAHYDNSANNPHNPHSPPMVVNFGEQTTDEMCFAFFSFTKDDEHLRTGKPVGGPIYDPNQSTTFSILFDRLDTAHVGWIDEAQVAAFVSRFNLGSEPGQKLDPSAVAAYLLGAYGKATKGRISKAEFIRMANRISN